MSEEKFDRRSQYWFGLKDKGGYIHRERLRNQGYAPDVFDGRPVIGKSALYLKSPEQAPDYILGYTISQDVSERHWQVERSGQWVKGKSFPTFNPMGPWIITADELAKNGFDANNLALSCTIDGQVRQNSRTNDLIFNINHCVWYISQFMELKAGDVINTGTPEGVGMGFKPEKFLKGGESIVTTIEGIGTIKNKVINY